MLIAWNEYAASLSGATYKFVECEECKQKYVYQMVRTGEGQGTSLYFLDNAGAKRRAEGQAKAVLEHKLKNECEAVPCPKCGCYQEEMIAKMRREYRVWLWWAGVVTMFSGGALGFLGVGYTVLDVTSKAAGVGLVAIGIASFAAGIGLIVWRMQMASAYEPNDLPVEDRLEVAAAKAQKVKNFEKWLKENDVDLATPESAQVN